MTDIIITMKDVRLAKMCSRGTRDFFLRHNLDWNEFLTNGIKASEIEKTKDSMALRVVEVARGRI